MFSTCSLTKRVRLLSRESAVSLDETPQQSDGQCTCNEMYVQTDDTVQRTQRVQIVRLTLGDNSAHCKSHIHDNGTVTSDQFEIDSS